MSNLERKVLETIKKYNLIEEGDRLVVAVSGGPDSICLLDILNKIIKQDENCSKGPSPMAKSCQKGPSLVATKED